MYRSISTVNTDSARSRFAADGRGIVWAVVSSGIDGSHRHFALHKNLELPDGLSHMDFTTLDAESPLTDEHGIGTSTAGIIAGEVTSPAENLVALSRSKDELGKVVYQPEALLSVAGMAPLCKLLSLKVVGADGQGRIPDTIVALQAVQRMNHYGDHLRVHGVYLSLGFSYEPEWFACGQSPLCLEVDRLVRSGVVVVTPAGNDGYGFTQAMSSGRPVPMGLVLSITDPGNAERAITVGSTHRDQPRKFGVSYFSGKGPTLDGRPKPDLVAPGQDIASCISSNVPGLKDPAGVEADYRESSGTSLAAAHVAGIAASLLSARRELIGQPETVKDVLLATAGDLGRERDYQGYGLVDAWGALEATAAGRLPQRPIAKSRAALEEPAVPLPSTALRTVSGKEMLNVQQSPDEKALEPGPLRLMCSYSHRDTQLWEELDVALSPLKRQGLIETWFDGRILAGDEWKGEITKNLEQADIIILLVSAYFMASDFCYSIELTRALERHEEGSVKVIPVLVRPTDWSDSPFSKLQALPQNNERQLVPVTKWDDQHEAWSLIAKGIRLAAQDLLSRT
jgi:serine protease AprX